MVRCERDTTAVQGHFLASSNRSAGMSMLWPCIQLSCVLFVAECTCIWLAV
jgi:hypothetical protein